MLRRVVHFRGFPSRVFAMRSFKVIVLENEVGHHKKATWGLETDLKLRFVNIDKTFANIDKTFANIDKTFDKLDKTFDRFDIIIQKIDALPTKMEAMFEKMASAQQKQFTQSYTRGFFSVVAVASLLVGSAWVLPQNEGDRLDNEIRRRSIKDGVDRMQKSA
ncbi:hypothetical protein QBC46DRAFT_139957 [Diplogelasinospora grovesii]|uniref:Transmembrane protein n=1 Tax=Diplogelasinospora grovesii TaxID=303347 RepID=A0AAN6S490_9PEZI|nr:hypothetical protein QBC46DRAFT_139957 [Diplogelasinospora grovesii]